MKSRDFIKVVSKNLRRRPLRTTLTVFGVALAVMLLVGIESFGIGMEQSLTSGDKAKTLVVYRQNRYCPQTSFLPERYVEEIQSIEGVDSVLPVKVFLNNCRTNLDMITFHGTPVETLLKARDIKLIDGDISRFRSEPDSALVGRRFAARRSINVGDKFRFGEVIVKVAGIFESSDTVQEGLVLTHLEFLQRAGAINRLGTVTQFDVRIDDPLRAKAISNEIDLRFANAEEPTDTRSMAAFLERATRDLGEILKFGRLFGLACVLVVIVLVANTITMSVNERRREFGVFRAIGFRARHLALMVLLESGVIALVGGIIGCVVMWIVLSLTVMSIGVEGIQVAFSTTPRVFLTGLGISAIASIAAGLIPALQAARVDVIRSLRSV